jgi:hypothetical protein
MLQDVYPNGQSSLGILSKAIKLQALADFIAEWPEIQQPTNNAILDHWKMYFDGSLKLGGAGAGVHLISCWYLLTSHLFWIVTH